MVHIKNNLTHQKLPYHEKYNEASERPLYMNLNISEKNPTNN